MSSLCCRAVLLLLVALTRVVVPAVVLPRPPSSPNYIPESTSSSSSSGSSSGSQEQDRQQQQQQQSDSSDPGKLQYNEKALYGSGSATNVEKPDIPDYRYLEIELRDADNVESIDLHGLVQAVLDAHQPQQQQQQQEPTEESEDESNQTLPHPIVVPHSILGVRDVGLGPSQRLFEPVRQHFNVYEAALAATSEAGDEGSTKNFNDEKLYYLKSGRPKVYVNFRGKSGNFRQDLGDSRVTVRIEPAAFLRATQSYRMEKKTKAPKKYDARLHGVSVAAVANQQRIVVSNINSPSSTTTTTTSRTTASTTTSTSSSSSTTTETNAMVTSSELPKQIPAPPSRVPSLLPIVHTTPVQRYTLRRSDILPGYSFPDASLNE